MDVTTPDDMEDDEQQIKEKLEEAIENAHPEEQPEQDPFSTDALGNDPEESGYSESIEA